MTKEPKEVLKYLICFFFIIFSTTFASAECRSQGRGTFNIAKGFGMDVYRVSDGGGCGIGYKSGGGISFTSAKILTPPSNGALVQNGNFHFRYKPKKNFAGEDRFIINLCGDYQGKISCVNNSYTIKVEIR